MPRLARNHPRRVIEALEASGGIIKTAAASLKLSPQRLRAICRENADIAAVLDESREHSLDLAESVILKALKDGDMSAAQYVLRHLGHSRGYRSGAAAILAADEEVDHQMIHDRQVAVLAILQDRHAHAQADDMLAASTGAKIGGPGV